MLQHLRDNSKGVVSGILIGLLVVIFALSGADALFNRDASTRSIVEVNGQKISELEVQRAIESQKQQMLARYGDSVPAEFLSEEYLREPVVENLISRNLLLQAATKADLVASSELLDQQIRSIPQFQQENGGFDANRYQIMLRNTGYTPTTYKKALADDVVVRQLEAGVINTSFITPAELDNVVALNFQTRNFNYAILPATKVRETVVVDEAEVQAYYDNNLQEFSNPEQVAVDYIELSVDDLLKDIDVSDEDVRKQYEQNLATFVATPERQAAHVLIESNDASVIAEVKTKLAAGEDFAELARQYSTDLGSNEQGGDLGYSTGDAFPEEFEVALSALSVGEISAPVVTEAGTHFIKKLAEKGTEAPSFEEERVSLTNQLKRNQAENLFVELLDKLRERSYNAESLVEVADELGLTHTNSGLFSRVNGQGITAEKPFITAAFSPDVLEQGNSSDVVELTPSHVVVLKKTDYKSSYVSELALVTKDIESALIERKARDLLAAQAGELKTEMKSGKALGELVAGLGVTVVAMEQASRNNSDVDRAIVSHAFSMPKPSGDTPVADFVLTNAGDYALIELTAVVLGGEQLPDDQKRVIAAQLSGIVGQNEFKNYQEMLRSSAKIER